MRWLRNTFGLSQSGPDLLIAYAILIAIIFVLQVFPVPGIFLMVLMAPLWIGLLVHVAMVHFAWLVIRGSIARAWLALPIGFYAAGYALHVVSVHAAQASADAINARNAAVHLSVEQPFRYLRTGNADSFSLIEHYRVDRSFLVQDKEVTTTYYARGADCDNANQGYYYERRHQPWAFRKDIFYHYRGSKTRQCILSQNVLRAEWRYRISANYSYAKDRASWLYSRRGKEFEIFDVREERVLGTIEVASFMPFPAIPRIVVGCFLNSGAAKWQCGWELAKDGASIAAGYKSRDKGDPQKNPFTPSLDPETWEVTQLARSLGLEPRRPTD